MIWMVARTQNCAGTVWKYWDRIIESLCAREKKGCSYCHKAGHKVCPYKAEDLNNCIRFDLRPFEQTGDDSTSDGTGGAVGGTQVVDLTRNEKLSI